MRAYALGGFLLSLVVGGSLMVVGCSGGPTASSAERHEFSATPYGLWSSTDPNVNLQAQFDNGGGANVTDARGMRAGTLAVDEANRSLTLNLEGQTETWKYQRDGLFLTVTLPDNRTVKMSMQ